MGYDPGQYPSKTWAELVGETVDILDVGEGYTVVRYKGSIYIVFDN